MKKRNIIGINVRRIRKEKMLTQEELAIKLDLLGINIDRPKISKIENQLREVTDFEVKAIANALDVNIEELFKNEGDEK